MPLLLIQYDLLAQDKHGAEAALVASTKEVTELYTYLLLFTLKDRQ